MGRNGSALEGARQRVGTSPGRGGFLRQSATREGLMPEQDETEGERAREAAQNPIRTGLEPAPRSERPWRALAGPALAVAAAVVVLFLFVAVIT